MPTPTPAELEILHVLWQCGEAKVQSVNDKLSESKPVGYTTTLKTMQIMEQKGLLGRKKDGKSHIYPKKSWTKLKHFSVTWINNHAHYGEPAAARLD